MLIAVITKSADPVFVIVTVFVLLLPTVNSGGAESGFSAVVQAVIP